MGNIKVGDIIYTKSLSLCFTSTPKVTGKGQRYFINKFLGDGEE